TPQAVPPPTGGTWQVVSNNFPGVQASNPLLLTDGAVLVHDACGSNWYKLTPDSTGSYLNGTWSSVASLPVIRGVPYPPLYSASAVLPDGRVIINGGEYNNDPATGSCGNFNIPRVNLGAIYDPVANSWTSVSGPGWTHIGDAAAVVLPNGTYMLGGCCNNPSVDALFNPATLGWMSTGAPSSYQNEQGYTLLPNGNVLTIDVW